MGGFAWLVNQVHTQRNARRGSASRSLRRAARAVTTSDMAQRIARPGVPLAMTLSGALGSTGIQPVAGKWAFLGGTALAMAYETTTARSSKALGELARQHLARGEPEIAVQLSNARLQVLSHAPHATTRRATEMLRRVMYCASVLGELQSETEDELTATKVRLAVSELERSVEMAEEFRGSLNARQLARLHREVWRLDAEIETWTDRAARYIARESFMEVFLEDPFPNFSQYAFALAADYVRAAADLRAEDEPDPVGIFRDCVGFDPADLESISDALDEIEYEHEVEQEIEADMISGPALEDDDDSWVVLEGDEAQADAYLDFAESHIADGLAVLADTANGSVIDATVRQLVESEDFPVDILLTACELAFRMTGDDRAEDFSEILAEDDVTFSRSLAFLGMDINPPQQALGF